MEVKAQRVRPPAVAGSFYPSQAEVLNQTIDRMVHGVSPRKPDVHVRAMVVPHAGYSYSGPTAAYGYRLLANDPHAYSRFVILCPAHRWPGEGVAAPEASRFATPLGEVAVDQEAIAALHEEQLVSILPEAHRQEHAIEVHLPFLQHICTEPFALVPLVVGRCSPRQVVRVLQHLMDAQTFLIVSSDLSHFLTDQDARQRDQHTVASLLNLQEEALDTEDACGYYALRGFLSFARQRNWSGEQVAYATSADNGGDRQRVVGYATLAYGET